MTGKEGLKAVALIGVLAVLLTAQSTAATETLFVNVRVLDSRKAPVAGLKAENFQIWEDGVEQKISSFSGPGPWDINFIRLDAGSRMNRLSVNEEMAAKISAATTAFRKAGNPENKYSFEALPDSVSGDMELFPAINRNIAELRKSTNPRRALIVITADFDNSFSHSYRIESTDIPIYFVFLRLPEISRGSSSEPDARYVGMTKGNAASDIASKTRGDLFSVAPGKVESQLLQIGQEIKDDYVVGFRSTNGAKDNTWRKLKVKATSPAGQNLTVRVKEKYFAQRP